MPPLRHARFLLLLSSSRRLAALLLVAAVATGGLAGCRRRVVRVVRVHPGQPGQKAVAVPTPPEKVVAPCNQRPLAVDAAALKRLLPPKPGLPDPFFQANVHLGQSARYLDKRLPGEAFIAWEPPFDPGTCIGLDTLFVAETNTTFVTSAFVRLPRAEARSLVTAVWGEPTVTRTSAGAPLTVWIDDLNGFQARLVDAPGEPAISILRISRYLTLDDLLGDTGVVFGFGRAAQPGDPITETLQLIPEEERPSPATLPPGTTRGRIRLTLPPLELGDEDTTAWITFDNGVVASISVLLPKNDDVRGRAGYRVAWKRAPFTFDEDADATHFAVKLSGAPAPTVTPDNPERVTAQCERVIDAFWRGVQPAPPLLKLDKRPGFEEEYKHSYAAERRREDCPRLTTWSRTCLEKADNAITSIQKCGINPFDFRPPDLVAMSDIVKYRKVDAAGQKRRLDQLVGRWADDTNFITLRFDARGTVDTSFTLYEAKHFRVVLDYDWLAALYDGQQFADVFTYALDGPDTLRFCVNTAFYHHSARIGSEESWVAKWNGDFLSYDGGRCTTVRDSGALVPTTCAVETDPDGRRWLKLSAQDSPDQEFRWLLLPGQFVDPGCPVLHRTK